MSCWSVRALTDTERPFICRALLLSDDGLIMYGVGLLNSSLQMGPKYGI